MLPAFRAAQVNLLKTISNSGMVVTLDIGENYDIHPSNKHDVGYRFAQLALNRAVSYTHLTLPPSDLV